MNSKKAKIILLFFGLIGFFIVYRLSNIQVLEYKHYRALAQGQQKIFYSSFGERGEVFFSHGEILASNVNIISVFAMPEEINEKENVSDILSEILKIEREEILEKIKNSSFDINLKSNISLEEENKIKELNISGIYLKEERKRFYSQKEMASQVIGFIGGENIGQYGIEGYYEDILRGKEIIEKNNFFAINSKSSKGSSLILTLDYNIQFMTERLLEKAKENLNIESGTIIVMNPKTGAIFAMANFPSFDPNNYSKVNNMAIFENLAIQKLFEPGSVSKAITIASAIDQKKITPETEYFDTGKIQIGGRTLSNYASRSYGKVNISDILEKSINTGAVFVSQRLGNDSFLYYLEKFGYFNSTGIDLQGEVSSENTEFKKGYEVNYATASFGHGINITPIQLIRTFLPFANDGKITRPYLVEKIIENGKVTDVAPNVSEEKIISSEAASKITTILVNVMEKGFGRSAKIPGYYVAGKTGTSQIPWSVLGINQKGYSDKTWQSFVGFAPAYNPHFIILVKLDNPGTKTAEYSAMPIFKELTEYLIGYFQIPPDYEI